MRFCSKCGTQVQEGVGFCPTCGNSMNSQANNQNQYNQQYSQPQYQQPQYQQQYAYNANMGGRPVVQKTEIVTAIILSIVTCGIYGIIWYIKIANDVNRICNDNGPSGGTVFLLTLVTCGIYGWFFYYNCGKRLAEAGRRYNVAIDDNSILYIILALVGLGIVDYCLIQNDINKFAA